MPDGHPKLFFKGGTSLSKAFGLIRRFSEDIDLVVHRDDLGFAGDRDPTVAGHLSNKKRAGLLRRLGIEAVPHGFRSSFDGWASERTDASREVIDLALAHVEANKKRAAYARSDLFERRRRLMEQWAEFLASASCESKVAPTHR